MEPQPLRELFKVDATVIVRIVLVESGPKMRRIGVDTQPLEHFSLRLGMLFVREDTIPVGVEPGEYLEGSSMLVDITHSLGCRQTAPSLPKAQRCIDRVASIA